MQRDRFSLSLVWCWERCNDLIVEFLPLFFFFFFFFSLSNELQPAFNFYFAGWFKYPWGSAEKISSRICCLKSACQFIALLSWWKPMAGWLIDFGLISHMFTLDIGVGLRIISHLKESWDGPWESCHHAAREIDVSIHRRAVSCQNQWNRFTGEL